MRKLNKLTELIKLIKMFKLQIITPDRIAYEEEVNALSVPSVTGQLGILPRHIGLLTTLTDGEIKIKKGTEEIFLAIGEGFLEVGADKTTILVTRAERALELDEKRILEARREAERSLAEKPSEEEAARYQAILRSTLVDLKLLRRRGKTKRL